MLGFFLICARRDSGAISAVSPSFINLSRQTPPGRGKSRLITGKSYKATPLKTNYYHAAFKSVFLTLFRSRLSP